MDNNRNIDRFEESVHSAIQGVELAPSPELWSRIEASLDSEAKLSPWLTLAKWGGAVAASVAIAMAVSTLFTVDTVPDSYQVMLSSSEFMEFEKSPILFDPVSLSDPRFMLATNSEPAWQDDNHPESIVEEILDESSSVGAQQKHEEENTPEQAQGGVNSEPSVVLLDVSNQPIDFERVRGKKKTRRYLTSTAATALAATSLAAIDFGAGAGSSVMMDNAVGSELELYDPDKSTSQSDNLATLFSDNYYKPTGASHSLPISYGLNAAYRLSERWSLESGVNYTRLNSEITLEYFDEPLSQLVQFVGVPLRVNYDLYSTSKFSVYMGVGGELERCISATLNSNKLSENLWHGSIQGAFGVQFKVCEWLGVYAEPEVGYYFTPTKLETIRSEKPLNINLRFGLRLLLGEKSE